MKLSPFIVNIMLIGICFMSNTSFAQAKYRCGNSFQDKPCADGKGSAIGRHLAPSQNQQSGEAKEKVGIDSQCSQRGDEALKIIWKRDGGALKEDLLAKASGSDQRDLIGDVYANRGNAMDVRKKIENECMAAKESPLDRLKKIQQQNQQQNQLNGETDPQVQHKVLLEPNLQNNVSAERMKLQKCDALQSQLIILKQEMRAGGDAQNMDRMNSESRALEKERRTLKCS